MNCNNALFYNKRAKLQVLGSWAFYPNPANLLRYVACYRLKPVGYSAASAEPLPGAAPQPDLVVTLAARLAAGTTAATGPRPTALRFYALRPNPMPNEAWFGFDLPRAAPVTLEIFDLAGRRVARLVLGERVVRLP